MQNIYKFIVTTSHNTYTTFCLHTENKYPMHIYTSTAHRPTQTHDPMCSTSYYPSLVSQTSQPPIHQRFPLISFLCAHRPNLEKKTCRPRAVTPKEAHTPHSTPLSTVLSTQSTHKASFVDTCVTVLQTWKVGSNSIFSPQYLARPCCQAKQQELSRCAKQDPTQVH